MTHFRAKGTCFSRILVPQPISQLASQPTSQAPSQPAAQPASRPASMCLPLSDGREQCPNRYVFVSKSIRFWRTIILGFLPNPTSQLAGCPSLPSPSSLPPPLYVLKPGDSYPSAFFEEPQSQIGGNSHMVLDLEILILQHSLKGLRARSVRIIVWSEAWRSLAFSIL